MKAGANFSELCEKTLEQFIDTLQQKNNGKTDNVQPVKTRLLSFFQKSSFCWIFMVLQPIQNLKR